MTIYRACLIGWDGERAAVRWILADDDDMAVAIVRDTNKGSPVSGSFELWQGERRIEQSKKERRRC